MEHEPGDSLFNERQVDLGFYLGCELLAGRALEIPKLQDHDGRLRIPPYDTGGHVDQGLDVRDLGLQDGVDGLRRNSAQPAP